MDPFAGQHEADVVVLGAGLSGCAAALELARRGLRTIVLEAAAVGSGATARDTGHVCAGPGLFYSEAIARWGREKARLVWESYREVHARLRELLAELPDDCGHRAAGGFVLVEERGDGVALAESEDLLREDGFAGEFLDRYMLETRFDVGGFTAGYWAADEAEVDPGRLVQALARSARGRGARVFEDASVLRVDMGPGGVEAVTARGRVRAGWVFLALGATTPQLVPPLAQGLRIVAEHGALFELERGVRLPSPARLTRGEAGWRVTPRGLAAVLRGEARPPAALEALVAAHVAAAGGVLRRWSDVRVWGPDELPVVGPLPGLPAAVACGYGATSEAQAVLAVRWAVETMVSGRAATPEPFRAARAVSPLRVPRQGGDLT